MPETAYLTSALVTGGLLLVVWLLVARMENWRRYELPYSEADRNRADLADSPAVWIAGFLALALVAGGGAVLLVSDAAIAADVGNWVAIAVLFGVMLVGYLLWGTYSSARHRGLYSAQAALLSAWLFASLFLVAVVAKLLVEG